MSEEQDQKDQPKLNLGASDPIGARFDQLEKMFAQFLIKSQEDCSKAVALYHTSTYILTYC